MCDGAAAAVQGKRLADEGAGGIRERELTRTVVHVWRLVKAYVLVRGSS